MRHGLKKLQFFGLAGLFALLLFFGSNTVCPAQGEALEQLLELLQQNGAISNEQAAMIMTTLKQDQKALAAREQELKKREMILLQRENASREKEKAFSIKAVADEGGKKEASVSSPSEETAQVKMSGGETQEVLQKDPEKKESAFTLDAVFDEGFYLRSREKDLFELRIGGLFQEDYRYFSYDSDADPDKNKFDIRRARLLLTGHLYRMFSYKFQYEFQGAGSRNLLDAYVDTSVLPFISFRAGQFKEPFSLEQYTTDQDIPFGERATGYYLTPGRDVGLMAHASFWDDRIYYGAGIFNGDGLDDTVGGDSDSPEFTGRIVYAPFRNMGIPLADGLQIGGSYSYAKADRNNVKVEVKTGGLTTFFNVNSAAKFNIIREVDSRTRYGAEMAWAYGPLLLWGEYINLRFSDVETSDAEFDINVKEHYGALLWMITGEKPALEHGVIQAIRPLRNLGQGGWGALGLAFRYDYFDGGDATYKYLVEPGISVREATAYTVALNWYLNPYLRLLINATSTRFDRPLLIMKDSLTGKAVYSDREDVVTGRIQLQF
ncbi:MAG: OprO/OprP family phosphate-selective porin [Deltaproteobacteria bacterium]|nr:OprO/OprP family phosphate-selective porin [Deltaproteobacteria bacterium]